MFSRAQKLELTREGMRSSIDNSLSNVEYVYAKDSKAEIEHFFDEKLKGSDFFNYQKENIGDNKKRVRGYIDGTSLYVFGKSEISFELLFDFGDNSVKISCELSKTNGKPLNLGLLFSKKTGKVRLAAPKTLIDTSINDLIKNIFDDRLIIK